MKTNLQKRIYLIDEMRAIAIILMIFYHFMYDLVYIFALADTRFFENSVMHYMQRYICISFIFISGISSRLSHSNLKRGIKIFLIALLMSAVTYIILPEQIVVFGVLHFLGLSMIIYSLKDKIANKIPCILGFFIMIFLFIVLFNLPNGYIGINNIFILNLPNQLYNFKFLFWLGLPNQSFYSSDYFPLIPWIFLFFAGGYIGKYFKEHKIPMFMYLKHNDFLCKLGQSSLLIYILHQPVIYIILFGFVNIIT